MIARQIALMCLCGSIAAAAGCDDAATAVSPSPASPLTEVFNGQFAVGGGASRAFTAAAAGTVSVALTSLGPPTDAVVGLGIGIPRADSVGCFLTQWTAVGASSAPQFTVTVDAGSYCVRIFDTGSLTAQIGFQATIVHP